MRLPEIAYTDNIKKKTQSVFKGLDHRLSAGDGDIYDMTNMSGRYYPLLSPRGERRRLRTLTAPGGLGGGDALWWADGTGFWYDGTLRGAVTAGEKVFAALGSVVVIFPDKTYYNTATETYGALEVSVGPVSATFQDGTYGGVAAAKNTIYAAGAAWGTHFRAGDAVTISGCGTLTGNNQTIIIREIDGDYLRFYENSFTNGTESAVSVARTVPDMDFLCANDNRLWGCKGDTIYCCKLGDVTNWNVFDGVGTDAWAVDVGSEGDFTGAFSYLGYPCFFKEGHVYKVFGSLPSNFSVTESAKLGVAEGSGKSLAVAGEVLFYLSRAGVCAWSGGAPTLAGEQLGRRLKNAVGGSDGQRYYMSAEDESGGHHLFVYDTSLGLWHREDASAAAGFAWCGNMHMLLRGGGLWLIGDITDAPEGSTAEGAVGWMAEFGDFTDAEPNKKGVSKVQLRLELDEAATVTVALRFDSGDGWEDVATLAAGAKRSYYLPIIPRRADHYRLRLTGTGGGRVYSVSREQYAGSGM